MSWHIVIRLESEVIFSSGQSSPAEVDLDILQDEYGFPYYGARTLKGMWREHTEYAALALSGGGRDSAMYQEMLRVIEDCFGRGGLADAVEGKLRITDGKIPPEVHQPFIHAIQNGNLHPEEVFQALTAIRYFTSIDSETGTAQQGAFRQFRVLLEGVELISEVQGIEDLQEWEIGLLACGLAGWQYAGMMKHRGKGRIRAALLKDGNNVMKPYLEAARKWESAS